MSPDEKKPYRCEQCGTSLQDHEIIEAKIGEYEHALNRAAEVYREIQQLIMTQNNDYSLNVMTTLTTCTINFKSLVEQTGTG